MYLNSLKKRICRISTRERMDEYDSCSRKKKKRGWYTKEKKILLEIFIQFLFQIVFRKQTYFIYNLIIIIRFIRFVHSNRTNFPTNKGINVFEIRAKTLLFKPMDKLTCYSIITPLKDKEFNSKLLITFLSLFLIVQKAFSKEILNSRDTFEIIFQILS